MSNYAQKVVEMSKGPLKPDQLQEFLTDEKRYRKILPVIKKYSNNIDEVKNQILGICNNVEGHMIYRKQQKELDDKLIKKIKKMNKSLEEEEKQGKNSHFLIQSTLPQYFYPKSDKAIDGNRRKPTKPNSLEISEKSKNGIGVKQPEKANRKRKFPANNETSSSQESDITRLASRFNKRLKLNSPQYSAESDQSSGHMSVDNTESRLSSPEPRSTSSAEGGQSSCELISVDSTEDEQISAKPVPTEKSRRKLDAKRANRLTKKVKLTKSTIELRRKISLRRMNQLGESSSQSDSVSADDSTETVKKTKSTKRLRGKVSKQQQLRLGKDASDHIGNEETVPERNLRVRK